MFVKATKHVLMIYNFFLRIKTSPALGRKHESGSKPTILSAVQGGEVTA